MDSLSLETAEMPPGKCRTTCPEVEGDKTGSKKVIVNEPVTNL